jgi:hypothetical protein
MSVPPTQKPSWHTDHYRERRNIFGNHCASSHNARPADRHTGEYNSVGTYVRPSPNANRSDFQICLNDGGFNGNASMGCPQYLRAGPPTHVVFDDKTSRVKVALWANPNVVTNPTRAVNATLNVRLGANEHAIADLESL